MKTWKKLKPIFTILLFSIIALFLVIWSRPSATAATSITEISLDRIPGKTSQTGFGLSRLEQWDSSRFRPTLNGLGVHFRVKILNDSLNTFNGCISQPYLINPVGTKQNWSFWEAEYHRYPSVGSFQLEPGEFEYLTFRVFNPG